MSNRYGHDPLDEPERHISRYQRAKNKLNREQPKSAESGAAKARIKPAENPARKGGPLPSDFVWYDYPLED
jgi:hypothetical protein